MAAPWPQVLLLEVLKFRIRQTETPCYVLLLLFVIAFYFDVTQAYRKVAGWHLELLHLLYPDNQLPNFPVSHFFYHSLPPAPHIQTCMYVYLYVHEFP